MGADPAGGGHHAGFGYHASLVGDPFRVVAYERAIRQCVAAGDAVLDVGTGTGILAALAARAGAGRVVAVESTGVAETARALIAENGLGDRVDVIHADLRDLPPPGPDEAVDVIVSDCLGRFVIDDFMTEAMAAALRWLKPGGRVIPASVRLMLAPVAAGWVDALDLWRPGLFGVSMQSIARAACHRPIGVALPAASVLAPPAEIGRWAPGDPTLRLADAPVTFEVATGGRWVGFAGWFEAALAPGVVLSTAPGIGTHWGQLLFPVAPRAIGAGARLAATLRTVGVLHEPLYRWDVSVVGGPLESYGHGASTEPPPATVPMSPEAVAEARAAGALAAEVGDFHRAAAELLAALAGAATVDAPTRLALAADTGAALLLAGRPAEALPLLLLVVDSASDLPGGTVDAADLEQALRLAVDAAFQTGRGGDGARLLAQYEAVYGPHPAGWRAASPPSPRG
jgi:protein arginine N-methyltransferase 1